MMKKMNKAGCPIWAEYYLRYIDTVYPELRMSGGEYKNKKGYFLKKDNGQLAGSSSEPIDFSGESGIIKIGINNVSGETATISKEKFTEYALNPSKQPDKAKAFKEALGYDSSNYHLLEKEIRNKFDKDKLILKGENEQGKKYESVMNISGVNGKTAKVLTAWIDDINDKNDFHLTTLHVDK